MVLNGAIRRLFHPHTAVDVASCHLEVGGCQMDYREVEWNFKLQTLFFAGSCKTYGIHGGGGGTGDAVRAVIGSNTNGMFERASGL
jgi:hypothetical protein